MAKAPVAGRVKTRLCPPLSASEAAGVAEAALAQTLEAVAASSADRKLLALSGQPGGWIPPGFTVFAQRGGSFNERLANAWFDAGGPGLQIGMDTPQVTAALLNDCLAEMDRPDHSAVLGPAEDGGWWALGLNWGWEVDVFRGVAMSTVTTGRDQRDRLEAVGHRVAPLPTLRDVDTFDDAVAVAACCPGSRLDRVLTTMLSTMVRP
jgi:hypothetical protein